MVALKTPSREQKNMLVTVGGGHADDQVTHRTKVKHLEQCPKVEEHVIPLQNKTATHTKDTAMQDNIGKNLLTPPKAETSQKHKDGQTTTQRTQLHGQEKERRRRQSYFGEPLCEFLLPFTQTTRTVLAATICRRQERSTQTVVRNAPEKEAQWTHSRQHAA